MPQFVVLDFALVNYSVPASFPFLCSTSDFLVGRGGFITLSSLGTLVVRKLVSYHGGTDGKEHGTLVATYRHGFTLAGEKFVLKVLSGESCAWICHLFVGFRAEGRARGR